MTCSVAMCKKKCLGKEIINQAQKKGINPFNTPFQPKDLGITAGDYGSFADWCSRKQTKSGRYNDCVCLTVQAKEAKTFRYRLLPQIEWYRLCQGK